MIIEQGKAFFFSFTKHEIQQGGGQTQAGAGGGDQPPHHAPGFS
jgi:hypothetical protein